MEKLAKLLPIKINPAWPLIWSVLYFCIIIFGLLSPTSVALSILKVLGIALCLIYVCIYFKKDTLLIIAFAFTLLADLLLALNNVSIFGVLSFCCAQLTHLYRLSNHARPVLALLISAVVVVFLATFVLPSSLGIISLGTVYALTIFANLLLAFEWYHSLKKSKKPNPSSLFFARNAALGFALFLCCDIFVLLSFATTVGALPAALAATVNYLAWVFYYPSQILISHSSKSMVQ